MPIKKSLEKKDSPDSARISTMVTESRIVMFDGLPISPSLERGLSEIRDIMKRENLTLCVLKSNDKIYFIPGEALV